MDNKKDRRKVDTRLIAPSNENEAEKKEFDKVINKIKKKKDKGYMHRKRCLTKLRKYVIKNDGKSHITAIKSLVKELSGSGSKYVHDAKQILQNHRFKSQFKIVSGKSKG